MSVHGSPRRSPVLLILACTLTLPAVDFVAEIQPLIGRYCTQCHDAERRKGGLDLTVLDDEARAAADPGLWRHIAELVDEGEMPPARAEQPDDAQRRLLLAYAEQVQRTELTWETHMRPLAEKYCVECHSSASGRVKGRFGNPVDFDVAASDDGRRRWLMWGRMAQILEDDKMPPRKGPHAKPERRPDEAERATMIAFARQQVRLQNQEMDCSDFGVRDPRWRNQMGTFVWSRRLTMDEYRISVEDLLGAAVVDPGLLPADGGGEGFDTTGNNLFTSTAHLEKMLSAADAAIRELYRGATPAVAMARDALLAPLSGNDLRQGVRSILAPLMRRAFRGEIAAERLERFAAVADGALDAGAEPRDALRLALSGVLIAPSFLFLSDDEARRKNMGVLDPYSLAGRLAIFLWSSVPDAELLDAAGAGQLDADGLARQARRMLADPRSAALGERFAQQWLGVTGIGVEVQPDTSVFSAYDAALGAAMRAEVTHTFAAWFREDRPLLELIDASTVWVDERLARHYGIAGVTGDRFREVPAPDRRRGGVIGMAAPLTATSAADRTNVVLRGKWVLEKLLGEHIPPPPPDVGNLPPPSVAGKVLTLRERLELHRSEPSCMACHQKLDPPGFALEGYDAIGAIRDTELGRPVDDLGTLPDGTAIHGAVGLKDLLLERRERFFRTMAKRLLDYAIGRDFRLYDRCSLDAVVAHCQTRGWTAAELVEAVVRSDSFRLRMYGAEFSNRGNVLIAPKGEEKR